MWQYIHRTKYFNYSTNFTRKKERKKSWPSTWSPSPKPCDVPFCAHTTFLFCLITSSSTGSTDWTNHLTLREWDLYLVKRKTLSSFDTSLSRSYFSNCRDSCWSRCKATHRKQGVTGKENALVVQVQSMCSDEGREAVNSVKWDKIISEYDRNSSRNLCVKLQLLRGETLLQLVRKSFS